MDPGRICSLLTGSAATDDRQTLPAAAGGIHEQGHTEGKCRFCHLLLIPACEVFVPTHGEALLLSAGENQ